MTPREKSVCGKARQRLRPLSLGVSQAFNSQFLPSVSLADTPSHSSALGAPGPDWDVGNRVSEKGVLQSQGSPLDRASRTPGLCPAVLTRFPSAVGLNPGKPSAPGGGRGKPARCIRAPVRCCHRRLYLKEVGEHLMHPGGRSPACQWLWEQRSPAWAGRRQRAPAPAAVPLGANLAPGGDAVLVLVC